MDTREIEEQMANLIQENKEIYKLLEEAQEAEKKLVSNKLKLQELAQEYYGSLIQEV